MRVTFYRWLLPVGLATASLIGSVQTASAQPGVRDHRGPRDRNGPAAGPRDAPPPIREERVKPRGRGWTWVPGFYDWKNGRWEWTGGRWEKTRQGRRWRPITWNLNNGVYVRVDGDWIDDQPNQAPPPVRDERFENRRGFTWVPGRWDWENGQYVWVEGRYEKERRGKRWRRDNWELKGGAWVRVEGGWDDDVGGPVGYPTQAPPPPRTENPGSKRGFVWVRGRYEWRNGAYAWVDGRWERERASERWNDGRWESRNGRYEWNDGNWERQEAALDTRGWTKIDDELFDEKNEYRQMDISQKQGKFNRIMLQVLDNNVDIRDVTILYTDGEKATPSLRRSFRNGTGTAAIDLAPGKILRALTLFVKTPGRARVLLWGQWAGGASPPSMPSYPPGTPPPSGGPSQPPPAPRAENPGTKSGFVWVRGQHEWRGNQYEWVNGHWERERARQRWIDGRWELQGRTYVWVPGNWQ